PPAAAADAAPEPAPPTPVGETPAGPADPRKPTADKIIAAALADDGAWQKLAWLTDRVGHRLSGSKGLEDAVSWAVAAMKADGHENVAAEPVMVPHWVRGAESGELVAPVRRPLHLLGLGMT